jgi:NAD(P)-dependent dehydrogenase (short-subunit alcohol dehydrogenase family)
VKTRSNIHILEADITDYSALQAAAAETARITGRSLDYLIGNAGIVPVCEHFRGSNGTQGQGRVGSKESPSRSGPGGRQARGASDRELS